ncbi:MAG: hypothetical protein V2I57_15555 [Xanthomonadales bacterium]|jgi:hypothetical protein|nr:hypothetical protein [Xanthomonadales bacterium]
MTALQVFVHIPKTGGTSLREAAARHYGEAAMLYDYSEHSAQTSPLVQEWIYRRKNFAGFAQAVTEGPYRFLAGHFHRVKYQDTFPDARYVTWMRDPGMRLWSMYRHFVRHKDYTSSFADFYRTPAFQNQQARVMGGSIDAFEYVGVLEHYAESLKGLKKTLGVRLELLDSNRAPANDGIPEPTAADWAAIRELHGEDFELYERAVSRFRRGGWWQRVFQPR